MATGAIVGAGLIGAGLGAIDFVCSFFSSIFVQETQMQKVAKKSFFFFN